ncbi:12160_t:CDS:2 [Entrophospora sp. SA101]|nr:17554_t:CDS:2 [Entrophospora sp. SA101]CAJ0845117.1 12160_t:CDS:2 [Entrophospora sp. SA101]
MEGLIVKNPSCTISRFNAIIPSQENIDINSNVSCIVHINLHSICVSKNEGGSHNLTRNGRNDVNNNNSSTQVLDSSRLHQDSGGCGVKQFGAINDVNTSLKNIAAPSAILSNSLSSTDEKPGKEFCLKTVNTASSKVKSYQGNCNISFIPQEFDSTLYPPYWNQYSSPPSFSTPFSPPPTDDRVDK